MTTPTATPATLVEALRRTEKRLTACARAFYGAGSAKALREAFDGWKEDAEAARSALAAAGEA